MTRTLSVTAKLRLAFLCLGAAFAAFGWFALGRMDVINAQSTEIEENWMPSIVAIDAINAAVSDYRVAECMHVLTTDDAGMARREAEMQELSQQLGNWRRKYEKLISSDEEREIYGKMSTSLDAYAESSRKAIELSRRNDNVKAAAALQASGALFDELNRLTDDLVALNIRGGIDASHRGDAVFASSRTAIMAAGLGTMLVAVILMLVFEHSISRPVVRVAGLLVRLAKGDLSVTISETGRTDEIGRLYQAAAAIAATVKAVAADLQTLVVAAEQGALSTRVEAEAHQGEFAVLVQGINQLIATLSRPLAEVAEVMQRVAGGDVRGRMTGAYEGELRAMKANLNRSLDALGNLLDELAAVAGLLAKGDLRASVDGTYQGDFAAIRTDLNHAVDQMRQTMAEIGANTQHVAVAATETAAAAGEVAGQSHLQLTMLTEVSGAVAQTSASVNEIAASSARGAALARSTATESEEGRVQLDRLAAAVDRIAASNTRVGRISDRISRIAEKTHVLSLNAGIEAARAGEHGVGFGIVAQQIGKLAEEAAAAVADIASLSEEASRDVAGGVAAAGETRHAIDRITAAAQDSESTIEGIAAAITQQAAAVQQLSRRVQDLQQSGQANAGAAEEINTTMSGLSRMVHDVAAQVDHFTLA